MDKKSVLQMLQADMARFHLESLEISKTIQDFKQDTKNYIAALICQITSYGSDAGPLLAKTPKIPKKRGTRIKAIPENSVMESDCSNLSNRSNRSSRADTIILETSDVRASRSKRGASVKAADIIKKQQSTTLQTKLRRPSNDGSDVPLASRIVKESGSKRPKESIVSSEEEDIRPPKQIKVEKKKTQSKKINDRTYEMTNDSTQFFVENQTIDSEKGKRTSLKRKLEEQTEDVNTTLTSEQSTRQNSLPSAEPVAKKANYSKFSPPKSEKESKFIHTLERISEKSSVSRQSKNSGHRNTRSSSSLINVHCSKKYKMNVINETVDMSNPDETVTSMYEDAIGKPIPIMNSTMNPNSIVTLEKMMNVTVLIEPLSARKVFNETVTIKKNSFKAPLSRNNSTIKQIPEENNTDGRSLATTSDAKIVSKSKKNTNFKTQKDAKIDRFNELITDDESSPERKNFKSKKETLLNQEKRVTRSNNNNSLISDEDEVLLTPVKIMSKVKKDFKGSVDKIKSTFKQAALFSPYAKDSVKKRVEAFEQVAISPKQGESETAGRVTRTKTRALAAASFTEAPAPTVAQKLARKSLAKAKKISLAKYAREHDDMKENENTNIIKPTKTTNSLEKSAQKPQPKTTPLGKNRMLQMPSSLSKNQNATPSNTHSLNNYSKTLTATRGNIVTTVDSFIQQKSASKMQDRAVEEKRRRAHDEDARRKREELLKAQAEEKRRKREEKELKNKLAREAKEKLDYEKRLRAEKEREEKAKLAQQMQEKQKEEMEKKRTAQIQRVLEKEERRKQEELYRLQRVQEQEEQERQLAEQKRREQEMEKRKQAEMRHQMAELKQKNHADKALLQAKAKAQKEVPISYKIDSDPDEDESDDESNPKHTIPPWSLKPVRQVQLVMQQHIPMKLLLRFFDAKKCTPDLKELFQGIDPKKLQRSSSAIWKTPPRYSMMNCSIIKD